MFLRTVNAVIMEHGVPGTTSLSVANTAPNVVLVGPVEIA